MVKLIIDTDLGPDCDDAGALAIANKLHNNGEAELLGVTHCTSDIGGAYTAAAINSYFSNESVRIGQINIKGFLDGEENKKFTDEIKENFICRYGERVFEEPVSMLREILANNRGVKLVCIGPLNNFAELLRSEPDAQSPLNGKELVGESIESVIIMGGDFREGEKSAEYNIRCDIDCAKYVAKNCPVPVVYCGVEVGKDVLTGQSLRDEDAENPIKTAYERFLEKSGHGNSFLRPSWDLIAVSYAIKGEMGLWELSDDVTVSFDENGVTVVEKGGKDRYLINRAEEEKISAELENLLRK